MLWLWPNLILPFRFSIIILWDRPFTHERYADRPLLDSPERIADMFREQNWLYSVENMQLALLDTRRRLIAAESIGQGTLNSLIVHPREVFSAAICKRASTVVLLHNHPSEDPSPSEADIRVTRDMIRAGQILKIEVLDHIIMSQSTGEQPRDYVSLRELAVFTNKWFPKAWERATIKVAMSNAKIPNNSLTPWLIALFSAFLANEGLANSYSLIQGDFTWHEAQANAESLGGHLATITSEEEWNTILSDLGSSLESKNIWLGGSDEGIEGVWEWVTGEPWDFTRWSLGTGNGGVDQPDNGNAFIDQNHLILGQSYNLHWDDVQYDHDVPYYLLEVENNPVPEPGATIGFLLFGVTATGLFRHHRLKS